MYHIIELSNYLIVLTFHVQHTSLLQFSGRAFLLPGTGYQLPGLKVDRSPNNRGFRIFSLVTGNRKLVTTTFTIHDFAYFRTRIPFSTLNLRYAFF
ncbi:hypothetical protein A3860_27915 [Niastella vici]|uniref:Uncharacterized protein n=1 Tax=Niastella vici TaxID=1703345 RepID=A0A1V9FW03_9BACT|nr:hypothetical protein A3860_27915 [Niastella vici]